ncbi:MAG: PHP domain-containing protein [Syntrophomonadaceae bacterium]
MTNREVARVLGSIADILQIKNDNPFKVKAYRNAAEVVYHLQEDLLTLYRDGSLRDIPGVGKSVQAGIIEMLEKGSMSYYDRLLEEVPSGVLDMLAIPGLGHKTINLIYTSLGITSRFELEQAAREHRIRQLPGMGAKSEQNIIKGIELLSQGAAKTTLGLARPLALEFLRYLERTGAVQRAALVGSVRRGKPQVGDVDVLVCANDLGALQHAVEAYPGLKKIDECSSTNIKGRLGWALPFEIIRVESEEFIASLFWTTGSKSFREAVLPGGNLQPFRGLADEAELFGKLGMQYIPPEMRENQGEIEIACRHELPHLVEAGDIKGDLHVHSSWSDGSVGMLEIARAARAMGYAYLAITDHSQSLSISKGLSEERLQAQIVSLGAINEQFKDFTILKGTEVDILKDGELDYHDQVLKNLDIVIASIHSHFKLDREAQTRRIIKAIEHPLVNIIGHLTGRLLGRRQGYELDVDRILEACAVNQVALEINSHPDRLDIDEGTARKAARLGVKMAVNSDAHDANDLQLVEYGIINARRGWLTENDIINCWEINKLRSFLNKDDRF